MTKALLLPLSFCLLLSACKKEEGEGGKAEIRGFVTRKDGLNGTPYPYMDQRVFIVYGDNDFYDDDVRTDGTGKYVFRWLRKGDYTVYTFGECQGSDCPGGTVQISRQVSIDGRKDVVIVPTMEAVNW
ncbi:MAG TPA: hypothetical protein VGE21_04360 [Flavobacteriales bacterium]